LQNKRHFDNVTNKPTWFMGKLCFKHMISHWCIFQGMKIIINGVVKANGWCVWGVKISYTHSSYHFSAHACSCTLARVHGSNYFGYLLGTLKLSNVSPCTHYWGEEDEEKTVYYYWCGQFLKYIHIIIT